MPDKPTILFTLEHYDKVGGGVFEVISQIVKRMHNDGYKIKIAATTSKGLYRAGRTIENGIEVNRFDVTGSIVYGLQGDVDGYNKFLLDQEYDVVVNYAAQQSITDICLLNADRIKKTKILIPCGYSGMYWPDFKQYFEKLTDYLVHYDAQIFHSINYRDHDYAVRNSLTNLHLIPNGFDRNDIETAQSGFREEYKIKTDTKILYTVANITGTKGHREAFILYMLALIRNSVLVFVGLPLHPRSKFWIPLSKLAVFLTCGWKRIIYITNGDHNTAIRGLKEADLFLFFSNIEYSPLVLFEAAGSGLPFIASDCGNSKEIAEWSGIGTIVETRKNEKGFSRINYMDAYKHIMAFFKRKEKPQLQNDFYNRFNWDYLAKEYEKIIVKTWQDHE